MYDAHVPQGGYHSTGLVFEKKTKPAKLGVVCVCVCGATAKMAVSALFNFAVDWTVQGLEFLPSWGTAASEREGPNQTLEAKWAVQRLDYHLGFATPRITT